MKQWYELLFDNYAQKYDQESFTEGTSGECDFFELEIMYNKKNRILDIGCGTGRHSIEMARRGYAVTGLDLSQSQLKRAREKARAQGLDVEFLQGDARLLSQMNFDELFDLVLMICEGGFPLMESDEMNYEILQGAVQTLRSPGKLIMTTLNGLFPLFHSVRDFLASNSKEGNASYSENNFDLMSFRDYNVTTIIDDNGVSKSLHCNERYYVPSEMTWLLKSLGMKNIAICGARLGTFSREHKLTTQDYEMLIIAEK